MALKRNPAHYKFFLIMAQIGVLGLAMSVLFWIMVSGNRERIENDLKTKLDSSTQAMAAQLKANQVPFSASNVEPGVFIINQTDGTVVIDRRNEGDAVQRLWQAYKTKVIYEMQKQKRGWIEYPDKSSWNFNEPQRIIRYISIDELNWILAIEDMQPSTLVLLKESVSPSSCLMIILIFIFGSVAMGLITTRYFDRIKRQISESLENNLLSLNGEEKLWGKSHGQIPPMDEVQAPRPIAPAAVDDPVMEEVFQKPQTVKKVNPQESDIPLPSKKTPKRNPESAGTQAMPMEDSVKALDVQHINSPALKKMLQEFRGK
jgi:hypothetical protein